MRSKEYVRAKSPILENENKKEEKIKEKDSGVTLKDFKNNIEDFEIKEILGFFFLLKNSKKLQNLKFYHNINKTRTRIICFCEAWNLKRN